jgi:phospholipase/carboxylesterase
MHQKEIHIAGKKLNEASRVLIMIHGRGGSAEDILSLAPHLNVKDYALIAPQATNHSWYPLSFLAPPSQNEPWLSSALKVLEEIRDDVLNQGITASNIYLVGFSQGACLTLEFVTRNAMKYGGVIAFTGGLIGDKLYVENYKGDFHETPVFIGSGDPDPHVPVERVKATTRLLQGMHARVIEKIYPGMGHTISQDEIAFVNRTIFT